MKTIFKKIYTYLDKKFKKYDIEISMKSYRNNRVIKSHNLTNTMTKSEFLNIMSNWFDNYVDNTQNKYQEVEIRFN